MLDIDAQKRTDLSLPPDSYVVAIFRDEGIVYQRWDAGTSMSVCIYRDSATGAERTLFSDGWLSSFDPETGNYTYSVWGDGMSRTYRANVETDVAPTLVLAEPNA